MELEEIFRWENKTGHTRGDFVKEIPELAIPLIFLLIIGSSFGTVGNILIILSVFTSRELNTTANLFVVSLAFADIFIASFVGPMNVVGITEGLDFFEPIYGLCVVIASICLTSCLCSLLGLMMIGINRYIHIVKHQYYYRIYSYRNTLIMVAGTWISAFLFQLGNFFGWGGHVFDKKTRSCIWDRMASRSFTFFFVFVLIGVPAIITAICYMKVYLFYRSSIKRVNQWNQNGSSTITATSCSTSGNRTSLRLAKTLFIIFFVFIMCWTPYAITTAADLHDEWSVVVHSLTVFLAHLNSSLNSILYGMTNPQFRNAYFNLARSFVNRMRTTFGYEKLSARVSSGCSSVTTHHTAKTTNKATTESSI